MPPVLEGIGVEDPFDSFAADPGQRGTFDQSVDADEPLDRLLDGGEGKIRPPENLVAFRDAVFLRSDQDVPEYHHALQVFCHTGGGSTTWIGIGWRL